MASKDRQRGWRAGWGLVLLLCFVPAVVNAQGDTPRKYALLVGINEYLAGEILDVPPLRFAVKDAKALGDALSERGWETRVVVAEEVTRQRIVRELHELSVRAKPQDKVLIYFTGHWVRDSSSSGRAYWLTYDATFVNLVAEGIRINQVLEDIRDIPAREKTVLFDHCYSGDLRAAVEATSSDGGRQAAPAIRLESGRTAREPYPSDFESEGRLVVLSATRGPAYEHEDWGHSMFTRAILDVLEDPMSDTSNPRDGKISLNEFLPQVAARVASMAADKALEQRIFESDISLDQLEWALFDAAAGGIEVDELRNVVIELDLAAGLDFEVKMACFELLSIWEQREQAGLDQEERHARIVYELRSIRDSGTSSLAVAKKQSLEALVVRLGLVGAISSGGTTTLVDLEPSPTDDSATVTKPPPPDTSSPMSESSPVDESPTTTRALLSDEEQAPDFDLGGDIFHALLIAVENYEQDSVDDLDRPILEAKSLRDVLVQRYEFDPENVTLLENPDRERILTVLEDLELKLGGTDSLLIFFAGHGYWREANEQGYWLPADAKQRNRAKWISNSDIRDAIYGIKTRHTLLISDACFSGGIFKERTAFNAGASKAIRELYRSPSRKAMTSGTLKTVPDKSVFLKYFKQRLEDNEDRFLTANQLFVSLRQAVINNTARSNNPQYGVIQEAGDEGGEFIFVRRTPGASGSTGDGQENR